MKAAKEKTFLLLAIALGCLLAPSATASSPHASTAKTRAELFLPDAQNRIEQSPLGPAKHVENYDPSWEVALESSVAPRSAGNSRLFTYSRRSEFVGDVFEVRHAGRAWATRHAPGPWAFEGGLDNTLKRIWRTGRIRRFSSVKEITGPAKDLFVRVRALGPARGWKRVGGQYFTTSPGDVNLAAGTILRPTVGHWIRFGADVGVYYTVDGALLVGSGYAIYVPANQLIRGEGE